MGATGGGHGRRGHSRVVCLTIVLGLSPGLFDRNGGKTLPVPVRVYVGGIPAPEATPVVEVPGGAVSTRLGNQGESSSWGSGGQVTCPGLSRTPVAGVRTHREMFLRNRTSEGPINVFSTSLVPRVCRLTGGGWGEGVVYTGPGVSPAVRGERPDVQDGDVYPQ